MVEQREQRRTGRTRWLDVLVTCATAGAVAGAFLYFTPIWSLLTTPGPIPKSAPEEANRVYHPFGFSIVAPANWRRIEVLVSDEDMPPEFPSCISISRGGSYPSRYGGAGISASMEDGQPEDLAEFTSVVFQDKPAFEQILIQPERGFEHPAHFDYTLAFQREDQWYTVSYNLFDIADLVQLPPEVYPYFETFRVHLRPTQTVVPSE